MCCTTRVLKSIITSVEPSTPTVLRWARLAQGWETGPWWWGWSLDTGGGMYAGTNGPGDKWEGELMGGQSWVRRQLMDDLVRWMDCNRFG